MLHTLSSRLSRTLRTIAIGVVLPFALLVTTAAADQPDAQLSITLSSDVETVAEGDSLTYTAEIRNSGATVNARVVLEQPAYIVLGAADGATLEENGATWSLTLEGGSTTSLEVPARIAEIPDGELRATALISVYVGDSTAPLIRTAAADRIEGVIDEQVTVPSAATVFLWVGVGIVLVLAAAATFFLLRARRQARATHGDGEARPISDGR